MSDLLLTYDTAIHQETSSSLNRRSSKRLLMNQGQKVQLIFNKEQIYNPCQGTIVDDSFNGCGLMVETTNKLLPQQTFLILIENLEPIQAQIAWSQQIEENRFRIGAKYLTSKSLKTKIFFQKTNTNTVRGNQKEFL